MKQKKIIFLLDFLFWILKKLFFFLFLFRIFLIAKLWVNSKWILLKTLGTLNNLIRICLKNVPLCLLIIIDQMIADKKKNSFFINDIKKTNYNHILFFKIYIFIIL
jgi:hypothetical protein